VKYLFFMLSVIAGLIGLVVLAGSKSAVHEIEALVLFLIAAVWFVGASVVAAIQDLKAAAANVNADRR
jgi:4-hydroxybenzoate polyprenyltransferase